MHSLLALNIQNIGSINALFLSAYRKSCEHECMHCSSSVI